VSGLTAGPGTSDHDDEPVGAVLKRMRQDKRMSGQKIAAIVHISQSTVSRIERGLGSTDPDDVRKIAQALGATDLVVRDLMERAERSHDRMTDWRPTTAALANRQKSMAGWESEADAIYDFQPALLPGLLQTSGYATATLQLFQGLAQLPTEELTQAAVLAAVTSRVHRQEVLANRAKSFSFVITEAVLKNPICPPAQMLAQIQHLRDVATGYPNVAVVAIPDGTAVAVPPLHGFTLFDDHMVEIDIYNTGLISRGRKDVETYRQIFGLFLDAAEDIEPMLEQHEALYLDRLRQPPPRR
jgi:transcriptional regulator with XRE-family HTH domain